MAAPTPTVRQTPAGLKLQDGYQSLLTFARDPDISIWEKSVQPPGVDTGDAIETTTMWNDDWRTKAPRALKEMTEFQITFAYDPACYTQIINIAGIPDTLTLKWGDGSTLAFYGFLKDVEFGELVEGEFPEGTATIVPTNWDHANDAESGPTLASVSGT